MISQKLMQVGGSGQYWFSLISIDGGTPTNSAPQVSIATDKEALFPLLRNVSTGFGHAIKVSSPGKIKLAKSLSLPGGFFYIYGTGFDSNKNLYLCGAYSDSSDNEVHLTKLTSAGVLVWSKKIKESLNKTFVVNYVFVDQNDDVFVVGETAGAAQLFKFSSAGALIFETNYNFGDPAVGVSNSVRAALSPNGDIAISGQKYDNLSERYDWVILKASGTNGSIISDRRFPSSSILDSDHGALAFDSTDAIIAMGDRPSTGGDVFIAKYSSSNVYQWGVRASGDGASRGAAVDGENNFYFCGANGQIGKINGADGSLMWLRTLSYNGSLVEVGSIAVSQDALYVQSDFICGRLPLDGAGAGVYDTITYAETTKSFTSVSDVSDSVSISTNALNFTVTDHTPVVQDTVTSSTTYRVRR